MRNFALVAACSLLATAAFAETVGEKTGINSTLGIAPTTKDFVREAAIGDMLEIQWSRAAAAMLTGAEKGIADHMIMDHTKATAELTDQAKGDNIPIPS